MELTAVNTFYHRAGAHLCFRNTTYTRRTLVVHILGGNQFHEPDRLLIIFTDPGLNTTQTAELFITGFLPLGDQTKFEYENQVRRLHAQASFTHFASA